MLIHMEPCDYRCGEACVSGCAVPGDEREAGHGIDTLAASILRPSYRRGGSAWASRVAGWSKQALASGASSLDEAAGKEFFAAYGIAVPQGGTARSADEAVRLAEQIGYPVVMKGSSAQIQHKTDAGLVLLRIGDEQEVARGLPHAGGPRGRRRRRLSMGCWWSIWSPASGSSWWGSSATGSSARW